MATRTADPPIGDELVGEFLAAGKSAEAVDRARLVLRTCEDPRRTASVSVLAMIAYLNLGGWRLPDYRAAADEARAAVDRYGAPSAVSQFHSVSAKIAALRGDVDEAITHLVDSERAAAAAPEGDPDTAAALRRLAGAQAALGFPESALDSLAQSEEGFTWWPGSGSRIGVRVDAALVLDCRGDTDGCMQQLDELLQPARDAADGEPLPYWDALNAAYAAARLELLGGEPGIAARDLLPPADGVAVVEMLRQTALATQSLAEGDHEAPARFLASLPLDSPMGVIETLRLRSIGLSALGDPTAALTTERQAFHLISDRSYRMHRTLAARLLHHQNEELLRATLIACTIESLTDPLTALPNRRHLDQRLTETIATDTPTALGMVDLDRFKQVNTTHGHVAGDRVLRHVAQLLTETLRPTDFVARYGGDEFVILLPGTTLPEAQAIGARISTAIAASNWPALAPDTPVGATFGWTEATGHLSPEAALAAADRAMYAAKP